MDALPSLNGDHRGLWLTLFAIFVVICLKLFIQTADAKQKDDPGEDQTGNGDRNSKL